MDMPFFRVLYIMYLTYSFSTSSFSDTFFFQYLLTTNLTVILILAILPNIYSLQARQISLTFGLKMFLISLAFYKNRFLALSNGEGLSSSMKILEVLQIYGNPVPFCCDNISLLLVALTTLLIFICLIISLDVPNFKLFAVCFFVMEFLLLLVWTVYDIFLFYVFFESVLIPMFFIIIIWGSRARKIRAGYLFFMYTVIGSMPMLFGVLYIYLNTGTTNVFFLQLMNSFDFIEQKCLWVTFFLAFAVKVPMVPFHLWLPEAHVEAPTAGSVILAGVLLKLGSYGLVRFLNPFFPLAGVYFTPFVQALSICGIVYASFNALRQNDLKRVIAYASIAHMNLIVVGIFSLSIYSIEGSVFQMISHGLVSSLLFFLIGIIYDRSGTRLIASYSGLAHFMPNYAYYFFLGTMANMAFPGSSSFAGEILLFLGIFLVNINTGFLSALGIFLCSTYSIWLYNRTMYGNISTTITSFTDMDYADVHVSKVLLYLILAFGLYPHYITTFIYFDALYLMALNS